MPFKDPPDATCIWLELRPSLPLAESEWIRGRSLPLGFKRSPASLRFKPAFYDSSPGSLRFFRRQELLLRRLEEPPLGLRHGLLPVRPSSAPLDIPGRKARADPVYKRRLLRVRPQPSGVRADAARARDISGERAGGTGFPQ